MSDDRPKTLRELQMTGMDPAKVLLEFVECGGKAKTALDLAEKLAESGAFREALQSLKEGEQYFMRAFDAMNAMVSLDEVRQRQQVKKITDGVSQGFGSKIRAMVAAGSAKLLGSGGRIEEAPAARGGSVGPGGAAEPLEAIPCEEHAACFVVGTEHYPIASERGTNRVVEEPELIEPATPEDETEPV